MSRNIIGKIRIKGDLVALTPISVGGIGDGEHVDLELAEDGTGRCYVPGTSLAGPMRAWLMSRLPPDPEAKSDDGPEDHSLIRALFGYVEEKGQKGQASALFVYDSPIKDKDVRRERRHGIAINAKTGTVEEGLFYTRALLPKNTRLPLEMELDVLEDYGKRFKIEIHGHPAGALARIVKALQDEDIRFGACKTRGMGRMKLEGLELDYYDFTNKDEDALTRWLNDQPSNTHDLGLAALAHFPEPNLNEGRLFTIAINWLAASPIMVKAGRDGMETDMMPLMSGSTDGKLSPVIPGSSLKGALRSQARKILNTLFGDPPAPPPSDKDDDEPWPILADLFGSKAQAGRLRIDDLYYERSISDKAWLEEDGAAMDEVTERRQHVAIDRFTGGASDGALYSARPVKRGEGWGPIVLGLDASNAVSEGDTRKELALLRLLIRDMEDGYIPIGFGTRRGLGEIEVEGVAYSEGFPSDAILQPAWDEFVASGGTGFGAVRDEGGERT